MRNQRRRLGGLVSDKGAERNHCAGLIAHIVFVHVGNKGAEGSISLHHHMIGAVVKGEVVDKQASHVRLHCGKNVGNIYPQFLTFVPVKCKVDAGSVGRIITISAGSSGVLMQSIDKLLNHGLKLVYIIGCAALLYLHAEPGSLANTTYRSRRGNHYVRIL